MVVMRFFLEEYKCIVENKENIQWGVNLPGSYEVLAQKRDAQKVERKKGGLGLISKGPVLMVVY